MVETGFYLVPFPDLKGGTRQTKTRLLSNKGDLQLRLKNGIVYNLRFGDLTGTESEIAATDNVAEDSPEAASVMGVNRYLFITAEFDSAIIPPPELKEIPEFSPEILDEADADEHEALQQGKETIERANQREQERYDAAIESGKKRAAELSDRFADGSYVISEDVYKKIHLTQENVFRAKQSDSDDESQWKELDLPFDLPDVGDLLELELSPSVPDEHLPDLPKVEMETEEGA
jgi:hypothetical protein